VSDDAILFDIDGTLYMGAAAVAGAPEAIALLRRRGIACRFVTNMTRRSRDGLHTHLLRLGFELDRDELFTAPVAAASWLESNGIRRIALYVPEQTHADFERFEIAGDSPDAVVVGDLGRGWDFDTLNRAFRQVLDGARLVALQRNRFWRTERGLELDAGPFVAALEYATGTKATIVGKPSHEFFSLAAASVGVETGRILVVGDDIETDIGGAQDAGMRGVLVRTGKFRQDQLIESGVAPFAILDSVADLPDLIDPSPDPDFDQGRGA